MTDPPPSSPQPSFSPPVPPPSANNNPTADTLNEDEDSADESAPLLIAYTDNDDSDEGRDEGPATSGTRAERRRRTPLLILPTTPPTPPPKPRYPTQLNSILIYTALFTSLISLFLAVIAIIATLIWYPKNCAYAFNYWIGLDLVLIISLISTTTSLISHSLLHSHRPLLPSSFTILISSSLISGVAFIPSILISTIRFKHEQCRYNCWPELDKSQQDCEENTRVIRIIGSIDMGLSLLLGLVQVGIVGVEIKSVVRRGSWRGKFKANRGKRTEWRWRVVDVDEDGDVGLERREEVGRYSDRALPDTPED